MTAQERRPPAVSDPAPAAAPVHATLARAIDPLQVLVRRLVPGDALELLGADRRAWLAVAHDTRRPLSSDGFTPVARATSHRRSSGIERQPATVLRDTPMRRASSATEPAARTALLRERLRSMRAVLQRGETDACPAAPSRWPAAPSARYFAGGLRFWRADRYWVGEVPVQRRNARVNALCPEKPSRNVSSVMDFAGSSI